MAKAATGRLTDKSTDKKLKMKKIISKRKSLGESSSSRLSDAYVSKKQKKKEDEETGGLKLLKRHCVTRSVFPGAKASGKSGWFFFNRIGTLCGKVAKEMQSYIGVLARRKITIIRKDWTKVSDAEKDNIWQRVQTAFVIG